MEHINKLLTTTDVMKAPSVAKPSIAPGGPAAPAPVDEEQKKEVCDAAEAATRMSEPMKQTMARLYENDPAGKEVSLRWTDGDVKGPFSKLDTIEKV
jgi:hypothetical protein